MAGELTGTVWSVNNGYLMFYKKGIVVFSAFTPAHYLSMTLLLLRYEKSFNPKACMNPVCISWAWVSVWAVIIYTTKVFLLIKAKTKWLLLSLSVHCIRILHKHTMFVYQSNQSKMKQSLEPRHLQALSTLQEEIWGLWTLQAALSCSGFSVCSDLHPQLWDTRTGVYVFPNTSNHCSIHIQPQMNSSQEDVETSQRWWREMLENE